MNLQKKTKFDEIDRVLGNIINSAYNTGTINGNVCGGLIGNVEGLMELYNSFNNGNINGNNSSGGLFGSVDSYINVNSSYNIGSIGGNGEIGEVIGSINVDDLTSSYIYYLSNNSSASTNQATSMNVNIHDLTKEEFISQTSFLGFDFSRIWEIKNERAYPTLRNIPYYYVTDIIPQYEVKTIKMDDDYILEYSLLLNNASNTKMIYKSNDESIVIVDDNGKVTPVSLGKTTISIIPEDNSYAEGLVTIQVIDSVSVDSVSFDVESMLINKGSSSQLEYTINPSDASNKNVIFTSSNENVATVDATGKVTGISNGTAIITITTEDGNKTDTINIIIKTPVKNVNFVDDTITIDEGEKKVLEYTINPNDASNKNVTFTSSNENVVTVDATGKVMGISNGTATITIITEDGNKTDTIDIMVNKLVELSSSTYNIISENRIVVIPSQVNGQTFKNNTTSSYDISFDDNTTYLGTGKEVNIVKNGNVITTYTILVYGDVNGDGKLTLSDIMKLARHVYGTNNPLSGIYLKAGDYNQDGKYKLSDIMHIAKKVYGGN